MLTVLAASLLAGAVPGDYAHGSDVSPLRFALACLHRGHAGCADALVRAFKGHPAIPMISVDLEGGVLTVFLRPSVELDRAAVEGIVSSAIGAPAMAAGSKARK